ncbi:MAG TPA: amidohydrolase family protein [Saprospiraceae bacterium]|nr:amidohydrolase family protein [Saprospiraceae bacterium]
MQRNFLFCILSVITFSVYAQTPVPAPPQEMPVYIVGATAHLGNGLVVENSIVAFENGKITLVRTPQTLPQVNLSRYKVIEAKGKHLYPGFIAPNTQLGLVEIEAVRATVDAGEIGELNPNARSIIAYDSDSEVPPTVRAQGILLAQITPQGGLLSGQSSIVQLDAWNWEDAAYKMDIGLHLNWPAMFSCNWREGSLSKNANYDKQVEVIETYLTEALAYCKNDKPAEKNLKLESACALFNGSRKLFLHADDAKAITAGVLLAKRFGITPVVVGGGDAAIIADFLRENHVPVILGNVHALPMRDDADVDAPFKLAAQLQQAGVMFCFSMDGFWQQRNLAFQAGHAVGFGLPYEQAVAALTLNTARILGIDATVGSIEEGKDAILFLCEGDALDMRSSKVSLAFINGRQISLDHKQLELYRKFKTKYERGGK